MQLFQYTQAKDPQSAIAAGAESTTSQQGATVRFIAGGTNLVDMMKLDVETPRRLVDVNHLPYNKIDRTPDGGLKIGATVRNSDLADDPNVIKDYTVLSEALLSGASSQLRNMATTAGNLLQRTRCLYFRDTAWPCNKRQPGSGCSAIEGYNRNLAVLGASDHCIASNPSDMNVALVALEAAIHAQGTKGERTIPIREFYKLPGDTPHIENVLEPGDLITHVTLPPPAKGSKSHYLKLRDRASYEFALASAAVIVTVADNKFTHVRIGLGGVGTIPWRAPEAEAVLLNQPINDALLKKAADAALQNAKPQTENAFKIELSKRCLIHALKTAAQKV